MNALYDKTGNRSNYITLDLNENNFKKNINMENIYFNDFSKYPDYKKYRKKFSPFYENISINKFMFTNGADEAIKLIFESLTKRNENILIPTPFFSMYKSLGKLYNLNFIKINYNKDLSFPINKIKKYLIDPKDNFKMIILTNPNNPTGTLINKKEIETILKLTKKNVIVDQTYIDFTDQDCIDLINKYSNLIIINSFSKLYGLAGLRLGMLFASRKIMKKIKKYRLPYNVNSMVLDIAYDLLKKKDYKKRMLANYRNEKKYLYNNFEKLKIKYFKTSTNFVLIKMKNPSEFLEYMKRNGILLKNIKNKKFKNLIRITVGKREENKKLLKLIDKYLQKKYIILDESVFLYCNNLYKKIKIILYSLTDKEYSKNFIKNKLLFSQLNNPEKLILKLVDKKKKKKALKMYKKIDKKSIIKTQLKQKEKYINFLKQNYLVGFLTDRSYFEINPLFDFIFSSKNLPDKDYLILTSKKKKSINNNKTCYFYNFSTIKKNSQQNIITNIAQGADIYEKINC